MTLAQLNSADSIQMLIAILIAVQFIHGVATVWVGSKTRKIDKLEDTIGKKTEELVDAKVGKKFAEFMNEIQKPLIELSVSVRAIHKRLDQGDQDFRDQDQKTQNVKEELLRNFVSKKEFGQLEQAVTDLRLSFERCKTKCEVQVRKANA